MDEINDTAPIACTLTTDAQRAERKRFRAELMPHISVLEKLPDGTRIRFREAPGVWESVEKLVALDKGCCSFLTQRTSRENHSIILDTTGEGEGKELARQIYDEFKPHSGITFGPKSLFAILSICGLACAAPFIAGAAGIMLAGAVGLGLEIALAALILLSAGGYWYYKTKYTSKNEGENANRGCC